MMKMEFGIGIVYFCREDSTAFFYFPYKNVPTLYQTPFLYINDNKFKFTLSNSKPLSLFTIYSYLMFFICSSNFLMAFEQIIATVGKNLFFLCYTFHINFLNYSSSHALTLDELFPNGPLLNFYLQISSMNALLRIENTFNSC